MIACGPSQSCWRCTRGPRSPCRQAGPASSGCGTTMSRSRPTRAGGLRQEWIEVPWTWVAGQWLQSVRLYERGFARVVYGVYHLQPIASGTRLYVYFGAVPSGLLGATMLRLGFPSIGKGYSALL